MTKIINLNTRQLITKNDKRHSQNIKIAKELNVIDFDTRQVKRTLTSSEIRSVMYSDLNRVKSSRSKSDSRYRDNARLLRSYINYDFSKRVA
tara:strand:- start:847 stop:1122 length:276 start_codon:yes stop_codon:yes gene_type:complete